MNDVTELVDLPDPAVQPLVHPLDLPQAWRPFRTYWLIATLTSPPVGLCAAAILWFTSHNYIGPATGGVAIIGFGHLASRYHRDQAWSFIPRKRQDRQRPLPATWELVSGLVFAAVLATALLLLAFRLDRSDVAVGVREFIFGSGAAAGVLVVDFIGTLVRHGRGERKRALFMLPAVIAVVAVVVVSYGVLLGSAGTLSSTAVWWGTATMLLAGAGVDIWKYAQHRRAVVA